MKIGDTVCVITDRYDNLPKYATGEICRMEKDWLHPYAVSVQGHRNPRSALGFYYVDTNELQKLDPPSMYPNTLLSPGIVNSEVYINAKFGEKEKENMKNKQLIKGYRMAGVRFSNGNTNVNGIPTTDGVPVLYAVYDDDIAENDYVLCATNTHGHVIGQITKFYTDEQDDLAVQYGREVICKIDYSNFVTRQERLRKIDKLKKQMAKKKEELNELAVYQALAATSPEMADMLKELKELL